MKKQIIKSLYFFLETLAIVRRGVSLSLQLNMCLIIMIYEKLPYEKARQRAIQMMTSSWGKNLLENHNIKILLLIIILPMFFLIAVPILILGITKNNLIFFISGWSIIFLAIIVSQIFSSLCSQLYAFAAYRYVITGKNDVYANIAIAPNAYRLTKLT